MAKQPKYQKHVKVAAADYEFDRNKLTLTACTPEGYANMQKHTLPFQLDGKVMRNLRADSIDEFADEIRSEGFTVAFVGEGQAKAA